MKKLATPLIQLPTERITLDQLRDAERGRRSRTLARVRTCHGFEYLALRIMLPSAAEWRLTFMGTELPLAWSFSGVRLNNQHMSWYDWRQARSRNRMLRTIAGDDIHLARGLIRAMPALLDRIAFIRGNQDDSLIVGSFAQGLLLAQGTLLSRKTS